MTQRKDIAGRPPSRINVGGNAEGAVRRGEELYRLLMQQLPNVAVFVFCAYWSPKVRR